MRWTTEEMLSAFVDGEQVPTADLAHALAEPGAREALIDFVLLRAAVQGDESEASGPAGHALQVQPRVSRTHARPGARRRVAAAAAAIVLLALGAWGLRHWTNSGPAGVAPPAASRVLKLECGREWKCNS